MKCTQLFLGLALMFFTGHVSIAQSGIYESYAILSINGGANTYFDMQASTGNPDFQGASLGTFVAGQSLVVKGGQNKTFKCGGCDITNGNFFYSVYPTGFPTGTFVQIGMGFVSNDPGGCGGNQTWEGTGGATNIIAGLVTQGNYTIEVYSSADFQFCGNGTHFSSNGGANYKATFNYCTFTTSVTPPSLLICPAGTGVLSASNGTSWMWSNGETTQSITAGAGTYIVTAFDGAGCSATAVGVLAEATPMTFNGIGDGTCPGQTNGIVTIDVFGGVPPYSYDFGAGATTTNFISNLAAGTYNCTVTDAIGCSIVAQGTVPEFTPPGLSIVGTNTNCLVSDGSADLTITGGAGGYSILWSNGETTEDVNSLGVGIYTVTVSDANGCTSSGSVNIGQFPDVVPPTLFCPLTQTLSGGLTATLPDYSSLAVVFDDCGAVTVVQASPLPGAVYNNTQTETVTLFATDASGNTATCTFDVNIIITGIACPPNPNVIYVDDNAAGANNGTTWDDAFNRLESALAIAVNGSQIWVKEGTYKPSAINNRSQFYNVPGGVSLYGGFPQSFDCNSDFSDRDPAVYLSILSGDLGVQGVNTDNSYSVVKMVNLGVNGARLDGFTISDANSLTVVNTAALVINADGLGRVSSPIIANCKFTNNENDLKGGAVYIRCYNGALVEPTFTDCIFNNNHAAEGGAIFANPKNTGSNISASFTNCEFVNNTANARGGAIYSWTYTLTNSIYLFDNCLFSGNQAGMDGGAVYNLLRLDGGTDFHFIGCDFVANTGRAGSAVYNSNLDGFSQNIFDRCTFTGNVASTNGTIYNNVSKGIASSDYNRCLFGNNTAVRGGGTYEYCAYSAGISTSNYENCVFHHNTASVSGGGIFINTRLASHYTGNVSFCTFSNNAATVSAISVSHNCAGNTQELSTLNISNSNFWGEAAGAVKPFITVGKKATTNLTSSTAPSATCLDINSGTGVFNCSGLMASDPLYVDAAAGDYHLQAGSPVIDAAVSGPAVDYEGGIRPSGIGYDYGAFEYGAVVPRMAATPLATAGLNMELFPNPATHYFTVRFDREVEGRVEVLNTSGQLVKNVTVLYGQTYLEMSLDEAASGNYVVRLVTDKETIVKKLVLQKP